MIAFILLETLNVQVVGKSLDLGCEGLKSQVFRVGTFQ